MNDYRYKDVFHIFVADWGDYVRKNNIQTVKGGNGHKDVMILCPLSMPLKECRYLNRELGLSKLNYKGNLNALKKLRT